MADEKPKKEPSQAKNVLAYALMGIGSGLTGTDYVGNFLKWKAKQEEPMSEFDKFFRLQNMAIENSRGGMSGSIGANLDIDQTATPSMAQIDPNRAFAMFKGGIRPDVPDVYASIGMDQSNQQKLAQGLDARAMEKEQDLAYKKQSDIAEANTKRETYTKDLESFFAVDDVLQDARGKGLGRFDAGIGMVWDGIKQDSPLGRAVAAHDAARKRLRVQLVRAAGDVGNINVVEQKAAEQMLPTLWDDAQTAELKRAYLKDIGKAINSGDGSEVKRVINGFMKKNIQQTLPEIDSALEDINKQLEALNGK